MTLQHLEQRLGEALAKNLGLRLALAIASPSGFKENLPELAKSLAKDAIKALPADVIRALQARP